MSNYSRNNIDISNKIVQYLYGKHREGFFPSISFNKLIDIFLSEDTLEKSMANVLVYESKAKHTMTINITEPLEEARGVLAALGIENMPTSDIYLESPRNSSKERLTYILGDL
jgi:hypothetical protein